MPFSMKDLAPGKIAAVDFGSTHVAPAIFGADGPEEIEVGKSKNEFGDGASMFLYPTTFIFPTEPRREIPKKIPNEGTGIKLAGFRPPPGQEVVYGIKQALDESLCKPGSQGARMRTLCASHGPVEDVLDDNLTKIFALLWTKIEEHRQKKGYGPPEQTWITVPSAYTRGRKGRLMQERLARCAISGGFPTEIGLKSEMEAVFHYLSYLRQKPEDVEPEGRRTQRNVGQGVVVMINCGGGIVDVSAVERLGRVNQLLCNSDSRPGGISDVFTQLQAKCKELGLPPGSFRILEQHIQEMDEDCQGVEIGGHSFEGKLLWKMIVDAYEEGFLLAESIIRKVPNVKEVYVFGRPPASNDLIGLVCEKRFRDLQERMRKEGILTDFEVEILGSDTSSKGVHLGACIPFVDDPVARFHEVCFGYIFSAKKRRKGRWVDMLRFQQVKAPNSEEIETYWEALQADGEDPNTLTIKLHMISAKHWKPLASMRSRETHRPVGPTTYAISMENIRVDLKGQANPNQWIWVRIQRKHPDLHPTVYKLQVDCRERGWDTPDPGEGDCIEVEFGICCDYERCYVVPVDGHQTDDEDGEEDARPVRDELPDSNFERGTPPTRRKRCAGPKPRGRTDASHPRKVQKTGSPTHQKAATRRRTSPQKRDPYDGPSTDEDSEMRAGRRESGAIAPDGSSDSLSVGRNVPDTIQSDPSQGNTGLNNVAESSAQQHQADSHTSPPNPVTPTSARRSGLPSEFGASPVQFQQHGQQQELRSTDAGTYSPTDQPPQQMNKNELVIGFSKSASKRTEERPGQSHQNTPGDRNAARNADDGAAENQLLQEIEKLSQNSGPALHQTRTAPPVHARQPLLDVPKARPAPDAELGSRAARVATEGNTAGTDQQKMDNLTSRAQVLSSPTARRSGQGAETALPTEPKTGHTAMSIRSLLEDVQQNSA